MSKSPESLGSKLDGWKEVAAYLKVGIRTAQDYERQRGLPIHRQADQDKSRVYAIPAELDAWIAERESAVGPEIQPSSTALGAGPADMLTEEPGAFDAKNDRVEVNRRQWLGKWGLAGGSAVLGLSGLGIAWPALRRLRQGPPVAFRVEGATLIILGKDAAELWRYTFPTQLYREDPSESLGHVAFSDLDGDGRIETLFVHSPAGEIDRHHLVCFNADGSLRWEFRAGKTVIDTWGRQFTPPYWVNSFVPIRQPGSKACHIIVSSHHHWSFPTQVAVLDASSGQVVSQYWHRGQLLHLAIADLDGIGQPAVLLAGVNDAPEYKQATLVVLDHRSISGSSKDPNGRPYFQGMEPGTERRIIFFPRTPISQRQEFNRAVRVSALPDRIAVTVAEGIEEAAPAVIYELGLNLQPISAALSDSLQNRYLEMQDARTLGKQSPEAIAAGLLKAIKVVNTKA